MKMRFLLTLVFLSMLLAGCSAIDDVDDAARILANYSDDVLRVVDKGDDAGRVLITNKTLASRAANSLDDATRLVPKPATWDDIFHASRARNVETIIDDVEDANRVKISPKLRDALDEMVKDTACLFLETAVSEQRLPTDDELNETLVKSGAGVLFKYADFETQFLYSVSSELYNLQSLKATTVQEKFQSLLFQKKYCNW